MIRITLPAVPVSVQPFRPVTLSLFCFWAVQGIGDQVSRGSSFANDLLWTLAKSFNLR